MKLTLRIWRQPDTETRGRFETYDITKATEDMSFLELLDLLNEQLIGKGVEPVAFDSDCREGICGSCGLMNHGPAPGPQAGTPYCQIPLRQYKDGDVIAVEPWRAAG